MPTFPPDERLRAVYNTIEPYIEKRFGIPVVISDVLDPFTGDLDGAEIRVDYANAIAHAVFIIAHLFGHTVQWNTSERAREIGRMVVEKPDEETLELLERYEREACAYSLQLFHDAGVHDLDQWLSDFSACDFAYLRHFYVSGGEKTDFMSLWKDGMPLLEPLPIPAFQPQRWMSRWDGTVV